MRWITSYKKTFSLSSGEIEAFSKTLEKSLQSMATERENRLRICLSLDEALLRLRDRFGEESEVTAVINRRLDRYYVQLELDGEPYNPLSQTESDLDDWNSLLMTAVGLSPRYNYTGRRNILRLTVPMKGINPVLKILIAVFAGVFLGVLANHSLDPQTQTSVSEYFMDPLYNAWNRLLNVLSGPVIFFMVLTTILNSGKITRQGADQKIVLFRYLVISVAISLFALFSVGLFFGVPFRNMTVHAGEVAGLLDKLFHLVPNEGISPFMEANTPQLLAIAAVVGNALLVIGEPAEELKRIFRQINMIGLILAEWVSRLVPFFVTIMIICEIMEDHMRFLTGITWKCLLFSLAASCICLLSVMCYLHLRRSTPILLLMKKLWPPFFMTLRTGSLNEAYGLTERCCVRYLGLDRNFTRVSMPYGLVLYMPVSVIGTMVFVIYSALQFEVTITPLWLLTAGVLGVILFIATPPVPGANLLAYIAVFGELGIPGEALVPAMIFDVLFGVFASAANQTMLQMELVLQAERIGMLDTERLNSDHG